MTREQEREASRRFGKHISGAKALVCLVFSVLCCLSPILLGLRLWEAIPPIVETGLITAEGMDDSMPRAVLVFGVPGVFALLDLVCHGQLWLHQKTLKIPPTAVRLLGRWTFAVLAALLCPFWMLRAAGETFGRVLPLTTVPALALLLVGARFFDLPRGEKPAYALPCIRRKDGAWRKTHRLAGLCWMSAGLLLLTLLFARGSLPALSALPTLLLLLAPFPAARLFALRENGDTKIKETERE